MFKHLINWSLALTFGIGLSQGAVAVEPPFSGTAFLHTGIITSLDWSAYNSMTYAGMEFRLVFDRRVNQFVNQQMHLFDAAFADGLSAEVQVNPEFGDQAAALVEAETYALAVGRLPTTMRSDVDSITIHKGQKDFGGGNRNILIHTDQAISYGGYLEEILLHESAHTSLDNPHASSPGWLSAQMNDPTFISTYARDNPTREDIAESVLAWFALRHTDALSSFQANAITSAIPNRLAYFDSLPFQLNDPMADEIGDFDDDGFVSAADYVVWRKSFGMSGLNPFEFGDGDGDGAVTVHDYEIWRRQFGLASPTASESTIEKVPEPRSAVAIGVGAILIYVTWLSRINKNSATADR